MPDDAFGGFAASAPASPSLEELARYDLTDLGNAYRLIRLNGGDVDRETFKVDAGHCRLLFLLGAGWIGFNGRYWDREFGEDLARQAGHVVAHKVRGLWDYLKDRATSKEFWAFANGCGSAGATSSMLKQAQSYLTVRIDAFDRDPLALTVENGTLKMSRRDNKLEIEIFDHNPADRITRMAAARFDSKAAAPIFEKTLQDVLADKEEREFFHRMLGYATTGCAVEQAFFLCQGRGRDGKSTLLDACRETLGGYAAAGDREVFLEGIQRGSGPSPELVKLSGDTRLVILSEPPRGSKLNEGLLKAWTSGSPLQARDLHAKPFEFRPIGKLIWECNAFPVARGDDDGIWRRIHTVLFRRQIPKELIDRNLPAKLSAERSGILNWLIAGVGDWLEKGLKPPDSLTAVLEDYRKASSPFGDWLSERCVHGEDVKGVRTLSSELYGDFKRWCEDQGMERIMSTRAFGDALRDRQVMLAGKDRSGHKYRGPIRLKTEKELEQDAKNSDPGAGGGSPIDFPPDDDDDPFQGDGQ